MARKILVPALALAGWLGLASIASAQNPATPIDAPALPVERPGRTVEALEVLTGVRPPGESESVGDEIETDRDSFTPATGTAGRRRLIVESAYSFLDNRGFKETHSFPELLLRYGLTDRVELRLGWNYEVGGETAEVSGIDAGGEGETSRGRLVREYTLSYGLKVGLTRQSGWVPRSAVILQGFTPTGGSAGVPTTTQLAATYAAGWELPNRWRFDAAVRYGTASDRDDRFNVWGPSAVLRVPIGERWAVHGEYFGIATSGKATNTTQHYFSPGVHHLVGQNLEVGVRLGWGLNDQSARFFVNAGLGWRF